MVENKCSNCGCNSEYTIHIYTDKEDMGKRPINAHVLVDIHTLQIIERWCLSCLFRKAPVMGQRE